MKSVLKKVWPWGKKPVVQTPPQQRVFLTMKRQVTGQVTGQVDACPCCEPKPIKEGKLYTDADAARLALADRLKRRKS